MARRATKQAAVMVSTVGRTFGPSGVAAAVSLSDVAARLAAADQAARDEAILGGLLYYAGDWLGGLSPDLRPRLTVASTRPHWQSQWHPLSPDLRPGLTDLAARVLAGAAAAPARSSWTWRRVAVAASRPDGAGRPRSAAWPIGCRSWPPAWRGWQRWKTAFRRPFKKRSWTALAEFAAGAGHEINNPLTVIAGRAQLFLQEETDPERRRALALINAQAMRVYEMIADLRLFARPPQPELQRVDLVELVDGLIAELAPLAAQEEIAVWREGDGGPLWIVADPTQLSVALRALCQNAIEALGGPGHIRIGLGRRPAAWRCASATTGPASRAAQRPHIFDPFYSARQAGRGLGLGLSKCWRIVTNHGGRIEVDSQGGGGASFLITLPASQPPSPEGSDR